MLRDIAWVAVAAALAAFLTLVLLGFGLALENWYLIAGAGITSALSAALAVLSLREDR